jgi:hypothetical protein
MAGDPGSRPRRGGAATPGAGERDGGGARTQHLERLSGELRTLGEALRDPSLDGKVSLFGTALALMGEHFRNPSPELRTWCRNVFDIPPRRLARHLGALGDALFSPDEPEQPRPGSAYDPAVLEALVVTRLDRVRLARLKRSPLPQRRW